MPQSVVPIWNLISSMWLVWVAIAAVLWLVMTAGGLGSIIAHGMTAVMSFGLNFLSRTLALGLLVGLILLAGVVFKSVGAPAINSYFPNNGSVSAVQASVPPTTP